MTKRIAAWLKGIPILLLLPYLITILFNGMYMALVTRMPDAEVCLPAILSRQIPPDNELENIKAQAVIARTNLYRKIERKENIFDILGEVEDGDIDWMTFFDETKIYEEAVTQTEGQVLEYEGRLCLVPYHAVSSGTTRSGEEVLHNKEYAYLKSVDSSVDKNSPDYLAASYIAAAQMPRELVIKERDSAGYITCLTADGNLLEGEAFRQGMNLASAAFTVQRVGGQYRFLCKGKGHGLGFSQHGGNVMAQAGSTKEEILKYYFPALTLREIHSIFAEK